MISGDKQSQACLKHCLFIIVAIIVVTSQLACTDISHWISFSFLILLKHLNNYLKHVAFDFDL